MKQFYIKIDSDGIIKCHYPINKKLPNYLISRLDTISISDNSNIYDNYSTYRNGIFTENKEKFDLKKLEIDNRIKLTRELREIKRWFSSTDWMNNKIVTGEWTKENEKYVAYLEERAIKRARQDEINNMLK